MKTFPLQGVISVTGTIPYTVPRGMRAKVNAIRVNNPAAYTFKLSKYDSKLLSSLDVYNLTLSAGDTVTDNYVYELNENDYIELTSSVAGTNYFLIVVEY